MEIVLNSRQIELASIRPNPLKPLDATNFDRNDTPSSSPSPDGQKVRVKQKCRKILIGLIISLSAVMFGYSLKEITSIPKDKIIPQHCNNLHPQSIPAQFIQQYSRNNIFNIQPFVTPIRSQYNITSVDAFTAQSILIGILPLGAVLGAIITKFLIKRFRRLTGIYIFTIVNIIAVVLINITTFPTLIAGRCIEGVCIGYYSAIAPVYLKEIAPKELRKMLGLFFSFGKVIGVLVVIAFELIFDAAKVELGWRVILSMTAVFSILQAVLIFFFGSDTPTEMLEKGNQEQAKNIIRRFYFEEYVEEVLNQYKQEYNMEMMKGKQILSENLNRRGTKHRIPESLHPSNEIEVMRAESSPNVGRHKPVNTASMNTEERIDINQDIDGGRVGSNDDEQEMTYEKKKNYAYCLCLHLCVIRHFTGGNAIISQGGLFVGYFDATLGTYTPLIINVIQLIFIIVGLVYIQRVVGKRPLFLFSITVMSLLNIAVAVSMYYENEAAIVTFLCVFMVIYGGSFIAPIWAYPSEIVPASQSLVPNIFHWVALALSTLIPPLVMKVMRDNNPYPVFFFFGLYGFLSLIHVGPYLRESDGLTYKEIIKSFV